MAILKYANQSGVVYAYESVSEWDSEKKQSRSKRKCIGRVDPVTGEIIPTSGKIRKSKDESASTVSEEKHRKLCEEYNEMKSQNEMLLEENKKLRAVIENISNMISGLQQSTE